MRFAKGVAAAMALSVASLSAVGTAEARDRHYHRHYHGGGGNAVAAGVVGLAAGAIIGSALAKPRYYEPVPVYPAPRRVYVEPVPVYEFEPWTAEWYSYCADRYRSFDARSGTFMGYDGYRHFCQ